MNPGQLQREARISGKNKIRQKRKTYPLPETDGCFDSVCVAGSVCRRTCASLEVCVGVGVRVFVCAQVWCVWHVCACTCVCVCGGVCSRGGAGPSMAGGGNRKMPQGGSLHVVLTLLGVVERLSLLHADRSARFARVTLELQDLHWLRHWGREWRPLALGFPFLTSPQSPRRAP